jgi:formate dehydrogenase subunit delta
MDLHRLIKMANEIGTFFESASDRPEAVASIAAHLRNFWDPRMRTQLIEHARGGDGELKDIVREAVLTLDTSRAA